MGLKVLERSIGGAGGGGTSKYHDGLCEELVKYMAKGYSFAGFGSSIGVSWRVTMDWVKRHKKFAAAKELGETHALHFWETVGIKGITGHLPGFNGSSYNFKMTSHFKKFGYGLDQRNITDEDSEDREQNDIGATPSERLLAIVKQAKA
jgi:hypothetical protein